MALRYSGLGEDDNDSVTKLEEIIDSKRKAKKIHLWPGCRKIAKGGDAVRVNVRRCTEMALTGHTPSTTKDVVQ